MQVTVKNSDKVEGLNEIIMKNNSMLCEINNHLDHITDDLIGTSQTNEESDTIRECCLIDMIKNQNCIIKEIFDQVVIIRRNIKGE